jgi:hypothetical protein
MQFPSNDSPFWPILKLFVIGGLMSALLEIGYSHGFEPAKDLPTIIATLTAIGAWDGVHRMIGNKKDDGNGG